MGKVLCITISGLLLAVLPVFAVVGPDPNPNAPRDLTPTSNVVHVVLQSDGVKTIITWTDPPEADFYRVEILRNDGGSSPVTGIVRAIVEKAVQRFEDREVSAGETYRYILRAVDLAYNTTLSPEYSVIIQVTATTSQVTTSPPAGAESLPLPAGLPAHAGTTAPAPPVATTPPLHGEQEHISPGTFAYGAARVRSLTIEQGLARVLAKELDALLPGVFNRLFHQATAKSKQWWYTYVNAYVYGGYTFEEMKQAARFGGKTVHPTISAAQWRSSPDYQAYINR